MGGVPPQTPPVRVDGLQIDEDRAFQNRFWSAERIAWAFFSLVVTGALLGLTGGGFLGRTTIALSSGAIDIPRVSRWEASDEIALAFHGDGSTHRLDLHAPFSEYFRIESIQPQPVRSASGGSGEVLEFQTDGAAPARATLHVRALSPGIARFRLALDGQRAEFTALILP